MNACKLFSMAYFFILDDIMYSISWDIAGGRNLSIFLFYIISMCEVYIRLVFLFFYTVIETRAFASKNNFLNEMQNKQGRYRPIVAKLS